MAKEEAVGFVKNRLKSDRHAPSGNVIVETLDYRAGWSADVKAAFTSRRAGSGLLRELYFTVYRRENSHPLLSDAAF
jgi:hypothetical protein